MFAILRLGFSFARKFNTQVFHDLSEKQLATPELVKKLLIKPIHMHSRMSQTNLFHKKRVRHSIRSCFSEKKTKVFKRVHKVKIILYSDILKQKIPLIMSKKAQRCITKHGSLDNYILLTKPQDLDSKRGEYLRQLMLRKINDPTYRIPYILGTKPFKRVRKFRPKLTKFQSRIQIPKEFKEKLMTLQKPFGKSVDELNQEDYKKYNQYQKLAKTMQNEVDDSHPLLIELSKKLNYQPSDEQSQRLNIMGEQAKHQYLNPKNPKYKDEIKRKHQKRILEYQVQTRKYRQAMAKHRVVKTNRQI